MSHRHQRQLIKRGWRVRIAEPIGREIEAADHNVLRLKIYARKDRSSETLKMATTAWAVEENTPISPLVFMHWFNLMPLSDKHLESFSSRSLLKEEDLYSFKGAVAEMLALISFPEISGEWKRIDSHLHQMISTASQLASLMSPDISAPRPSVAVPTAMAVRAALESSNKTRQLVEDTRRCLSDIQNVWQSELETIKPWVTKRGPKGDPALKVFAKRIISFAGNDLSLPSNESKDGKKSVRKTPLLKFMKEALEFLGLHGDQILQRSALPRDRKAKARKSLKSMVSKSDGALIDHLRAAKRGR